jgi:hypothetical protein
MLFMINAFAFLTILVRVVLLIMYVALHDLTSLAHDGLHKSPNLRNCFDGIGDYYKVLILRIRGRRLRYQYV